MLTKHFDLTQVCNWLFSNIERGNGGAGTYSIGITVMSSCFCHFQSQFVHGCSFLPMCGFIAQLGEHRTDIRGGHGFESLWSLGFFRLPLSNCLNWKIYCDDHSSHWSPTAIQIYKLFHIYFTSFHSSRENELNKLTSLPMCGFIAQLLEHRTGIRGGYGFESHWSLDFFRLLLSNCLNWKIYCDDHSSLWS